MRPDNEQLAVLRRLQSDGQISDEEFMSLARGLTGTEPLDVEPDHLDSELTATGGSSALHEPVDSPDGVHPADDSLDTAASNGEEAGDDPMPVGEQRPADAFLTPTFRQNLSVNYLVIVFVASMTLLVVGLAGVVSWWVCVPAIFVLVSTLVEGWGRLTLGAAVAVAVILPITLLIPIGDTAEPAQTATVTLPPVDPHPAIPGSLSVYMDQVIDRWNTVDGAPRINRGLTRHSEIGEYDTFIYRFGNWGRLAGAYDPDNDVIYALLVTGTFSAEDTDQLYLHLCSVIAPFSQECIDAYHEEGLDGGALEDFNDISRETEWTVGDQTWRLEIDGNVLTVRVYGPDAA